MADKVSFARLNGTNYENWSYRMKLLLIKEGCWSVVKEEKPEPITAAWSKLDELAMAHIGLCVEDNQLIHIKKAGNAADAWKKLEDFHVKKTMTTKVSIMRKICGSRLEKDSRENWVFTTMRIHKLYSN